jgi:hypothetical protein
MSKLDDLARLRAAKLERISNGADRPQPERSYHEVNQDSSKMQKQKMGRVAKLENVKENVKNGLAIESAASRAGSSPVAENHGTAKIGRPRAKDANRTLSATKPWEAEGISRRTWYRERRNAQEKAK